jgi:hypothetical protein
LLDGLVKGAKIEASFGATLVKGRDTFVNKLLQLHIRSSETEGRINDFQPAPCVGAAWALYLLLLPPKDTASWPQTGVFTGYYRSGYEISDFRPAGTNEVWWLSGRAGLQLRCDRSAACYLVVRGQLGDMGPQGHMSSYKRQLWVTDIIEQRPLNPEEKVTF